MNIYDVLMILFIVVIQMCVGVFLVFGIVYVGVVIRGCENSVVEWISCLVFYVIGLVMVFGFFVFMFYMGYLVYIFNVLCYLQIFWLLCEIMFGFGFVLFGFVFVMLSWFK